MMPTRRNSQRSILSNFNEKRNTSWSRCFTLKTLRKFASATGLCCSVGNHNSDRDSMLDTCRNDYTTIRRASDGIALAAASGCGCIVTAPVGQRNSFVSSRCETEVCFGPHYVPSRRASAQSPNQAGDSINHVITGDQKLQQLLASVTLRLQHLLALEDRSPTRCFASQQKRSESTDSVSTDSTELAADQPPTYYNASWDAQSRTLSVSLSPSRTGYTHVIPHGAPSDYTQRSEPLNANIHQQAVSSESPRSHRRLSARYSADSGFFSMFPHYTPVICCYAA